MKRAIHSGCLAFLTVLILTALPASAQRVNFHGHVFGDFYTITAHHIEDLEGKNAFWFRQIYLTMDFEIADQWTARLRQVMSSPGDFESARGLNPGFEDMYLKWHNEQHEVSLGLTETPTWGGVEPVWGYRAVEKTLLDLHGLGSARDIGVAAKGSFDKGQKLRYHAMFGNGNAVLSETNDGKKLFLSLGYYPNKSFVFEVYGDYDNQPGRSDRYTVQGFVAYQSPRGRIGFQYVHQMRQNAAEPNMTINGLSLFGSGPLIGRVNGFLRVDRMFDANPDGASIPYLPFDPTVGSMLFIGGVEFRPHEQISLMPNVEVVRYDELDGHRPATDIIPRVSFYFRF